MPRFAANLSMMFTEAPFIERFAAAAEAGFQAVEFLFPYDFAASEIKAQLSRHNLTLALFNTSAGDTAAGEWGRAALPGREHDARADIDLALEYALALECEQVHIMAGVVPDGADGARYRATFIDNLRYAADRFAAHDKRILIEALSPGVKPGYLFPANIRRWASQKRLTARMCSSSSTLSTRKSGWQFESPDSRVCGPLYPCTNRLATGQT